MKYKDEFLENLRGNQYSKNTVKNYGRDLSTIGEILEDNNCSTDRLEPRAVQTLREELLSRGLNPRSVNRMLASLKSYYRYAESMGYVEPCRHFIVPIRTSTKIKGRVEQSVVEEVLESIREMEGNEYVAVRNRVMFELLASTGMRVGELVSLDRDDIDPRVNEIRIIGKGNKERIAYMTPRCRRYLNEYLKERDVQFEKCEALFVPLRGSRAVSNNPRLSVRYIQRKIKEYSGELGHNSITAHSFRHMFATRMSEMGVAVEQIQRLLGHDSINTTMKYVHVSDRLVKESFERLHFMK